MAHKRVDKASDETINKTFSEYKQRELDGKVPKNIISLYCIGILKWLKTKA